MKEKVLPDTDRHFRCPMPGQVVSIDVAVGDVIEEGQALCRVEAMKMENVLKSERGGVIKSIRTNPGDSMAVGDVIMEFE